MIAKIAIDKASFGFDKLFDYSVPKQFENKIAVGIRVMVPFGAGTKKRQGIVFAISENFEGDPKKLKEIAFILDEEPVISSELTELSKYLSLHTFCPLFEAVKAMLPPGLNFKPVYNYSVTSKESSNDEEQSIINWLKKKKNGAEGANINKAFGFADSEVIDRMAEKGLLKKTESTKRKIGDETAKSARLCENIKNIKRVTPKQQEVINFLSEVGFASIKEITYFTGAGKAVIDTLEKKGAVEFLEKEILRKPYKDAIRKLDPKDVILSAEQEKAFKGVSELCDKEEQSTALLFGVTGSGKTQVFIKLIERELEKGKQVILMVPEISLTPQMMSKFFSYFGDKVAVLHSALSAGERIDEWKRISKGSARIIIGTRSAVFAPTKELGLIIMDEEQEQSYKSDRSPRFHARDVAIFRCKRFKIPLLLASATPSIETYYKAKNGKIALFEMEKRYGEASLPNSVIVDMKEEIKAGRTGVLSTALADEIQNNLENGEQSILLMNRRGYNTIERCAKCGEVKECPRCNIPLIYHKANGRLMCHYCGHSEEASTKCDKCKSEYVMYSGCGTQKVEDQIAELFPNARILRMDLDTNMTKFSHDMHFTDFAQGKYDIMIGTQMVAKGLDFPNVTLVGVLAADMTLFGDDYRSYERTFGLLTQVIGRCGRAKLSGRAYIQTYSPEHSVIELACKQNYKLFYENEILNRKVMLYPPFCSMGSVLFSGPSEKQTREAAVAFSKLLEKILEGKNIPIRILGPTPSRVLKIADNYRYKLIIKYRADNAFFETMGEALKEFSKNKEFVKTEVTPDPYDIN